ncbi:MAG: GntR family transcriptional regulator [Bacteroidaceae bacterium]|nr:GntR family transcriptional regulator [Bacteroidaceae bacterium]MBR1800546.1 GntR family transcriptional regulator [Bacteroidaceae bacterium]
MKLQLGKMNTLRVLRRADQGLYLSGGPEDILLPNRYVPEGTQEGDDIEVFVYLDAEERLIATTETPKAQVGDFAWLQVAWVNQFGAFLDWGLMKDLFVPFREQKMKMQKGKSYLVHLHIDPESYRIMASAKVERYLSTDYPPYHGGDAVELLVWQKTDLGFKVIIDNRFGGLLFDDEIFRPLHSGDRLTGYIKQVRPDGKIDVSLQRKGQKAVHDFSDILLEHLQHNGGFTPLGDKSPAEEIYALFGVSKKVFKKAVGDLYKRHLITIEPEGVRITETLKD